MPFDPFTFTPNKVLRAPHLQWRALPAEGGMWRIEARVLPDGEWVEQPDEVVRDEVGHGTEAGAWLGGWL